MVHNWVSLSYLSKVNISSFLLELLKIGSEDTYLLILLTRSCHLRIALYACFVCVCLCFDIYYFVSIVVLQSSWRGRESWLPLYYCVTDVLLLYIFFVSSSRYHGLIFSMWLWYFLIILTFCYILVCILLDKAHVAKNMYLEHQYLRAFW